uniref:UBC core domain-containing protein n=1 Tax=Rodentolepis nana TaxID=102285 RepID=A0A0R3TS17_RODNA
LNSQLMTNYNLKSPGKFHKKLLILKAVKRLMREAQELSKPTELYYAQPLEDNLFEWHFTIRGPEGSEFEGGIYHGQISLPTEYPMKPPNIMLLTPNGRFEQYRQICLSISGYHPETWCPSWSIRTALLAIIGFMPTDGAGAIGSMSVPIEERKKLAISSKNYVCNVCGPTKDLLLPLTSASTITAEEAKAVASQFVLTDPNAPKSETLSPEARNSESTEGTNVEIGAPQMMSQPGVVPTNLQPPNPLVNGTANPKPIYWLCYPVYSMTGVTNGISISAAPSSGDNSSSATSKKDPPLSFENWLKQIHPSSSDVAGSSVSPRKFRPPPLINFTSYDQVKLDNSNKSSFGGQCKENAEVSNRCPRPTQKSTNYDCQNRLSSSLSPTRMTFTHIHHRISFDQIIQDTDKNNTPPLCLVTDDVTEDFTLSSMDVTERTRPSDFHRICPHIEDASVTVPNYESKPISETSGVKTSQQDSTKDVSEDAGMLGEEIQEKCEKKVESTTDKNKLEANKEVSADESIVTTPDQTAGGEKPLISKESAPSEENAIADHVKEHSEVQKKADDTSEAPSNYQRDSSSTKATIPEETELQGNPPAEPEEAKPTTSETGSFDVAASNEIARRLFREAAERHRQRAQRILSRYDDTDVNPNRSIRSERALKGIIFAVAMALIALLIRRIMIMSTTGPH